MNKKIDAIFLNLYILLDIYACSVGMIPTVQTRTFIVWMDIAKDVYRVRFLIEKNLPAVVLKSQKTAAHVFLGRPLYPSRYIIEKILMVVVTIKNYF